MCFPALTLKNICSALQPPLWPLCSCKVTPNTKITGYISTGGEAQHDAKDLCSRVSCIYLCVSCFTRIWRSLKCHASCSYKLNVKREDHLNTELMGTLWPLQPIWPFFFSNVLKKNIYAGSDRTVAVSVFQVWAHHPQTKNDLTKKGVTMKTSRCDSLS